MGAGMMCSAAPRAPTADSRHAGGGATAAAAGAVLPAAPRSKPPPSSAAHPDAAHTINFYPNLLFSQLMSIFTLISHKYIPDLSKTAQLTHGVTNYHSIAVI